MGERLAHSGPPSFGWSHPHSPARRTPKTMSASPSADSTEPTTSRRGRFSTGASSIRLLRTRIARTITTSPANTHRHEKYVVQKPPINGPTATAIAPAAATRP